MIFNITRTAFVHGVKRFEVIILKITFIIFILSWTVFLYKVFCARCSIYKSGLNCMEACQAILLQRPIISLLGTNIVKIYPMVDTRWHTNCVHLKIVPPISYRQLNQKLVEKITSSSEESCWPPCETWLNWMTRRDTSWESPHQQLVMWRKCLANIREAYWKEFCRPSKRQPEVVKVLIHLLLIPSAPTIARMFPEIHTREYILYLYRPNWQSNTLEIVGKQWTFCPKCLLLLRLKNSHNWMNT